MVNQIKKTLQYYCQYSKKTIIIFWLSYFSFLVLSLFLSLYDSVVFEFYGITSIISMIFIVFYSILTFKNTFPFVIKLGVNRKAFILSTYIFGIILSTLLVAVNYIYLYLFNSLVDLLSIDSYIFIGMNMPEYTEAIFGNVYLFDWLLHISLFLFFTFIGAFFYRFGIIYGTALISIAPLSMFIRSVGIKIVETLSYFSIFQEDYTAFSYLILSVVCIALNWFVVQRASILDQITKQN